VPAPIGERAMTGAERARKFRQAHRKPKPGEPAPPSPAPRPVPEGRLRNLEYDVELRQAFYVPRADLACRPASSGRGGHRRAAGFSPGGTDAASPPSSSGRGVR
jgi:hypothetical protein